MSGARDALERLIEARAAEKEQTLFYRALAGDAEAAGDAELAERLNGLLADEQHHLSRLTARLLELGVTLPPLDEVEAPATALADWEEAARERERQEVRRYESVPRAQLDERTAEVLEEILEAERHHVTALGGKWMNA